MLDVEASDMIDVRIERLFANSWVDSPTQAGRKQQCFPKI